MLASNRYMDSIISGLSILRQVVKTKVKLGLYDTNLYCENFFRDIFNLAYDIKLVNLNVEKKNYPGIDLGDKTKETALQITSTKTSPKIQDSIDAFIKHKKYKEYKRVIIFILTEKQTTYPDFKTQGKLIFDPDKDVIDTDDIIAHISILDVKVKKNIAEYVDQQLPTVRKSLEVESLLGGLDKNSGTCSKTCSGINKLLGWELDKEDLVDTEKSFKQLHTQLSKLTKPTREVLYMIMERGKTNFSSSYHDQIVTLPQDLENVLRITCDRLGKELDILRAHKFIDFDNDDGVDIIVLSAPKIDWPILNDLKKFARKANIPLSDIIVNLDFAILD